MRLTYLIGNGFDIGLGLNTRYQDFLDTYLSVSGSTALLSQFKNHIDKDRETWSDAELAFGQLPFSELDSNVENTFRICFRDFLGGLRKYLRKEDARLDRKLITGEMRNQFRHALIELIKHVSLRHRRLYLSIFGDARSQSVVNCINFNYTYAFDDLFCAPSSEESKEFVYKDDEIGRERNFIIGDCVHVHGDLNPGRFLFGVNNVEQITDDKFSDISSKFGYLIKPRMAKEGGCTFYRAAESLLSRSDVVVLFGLSYGETDSAWWNAIASRVKQGSLIAVLCPYATTPIEAVDIPDEIYVEKQEAKRFLLKTYFGEGLYLQDIGHARLMSILHGPYDDPEKKKERYYCDPLHLDYFGRHLVKDFQREPIKYDE